MTNYDHLLLASKNAFSSATMLHLPSPSPGRCCVRESEVTETRSAVPRRTVAGVGCSISGISIHPPLWPLIHLALQRSPHLTYPASRPPPQAFGAAAAPSIHPVPSPGPAHQYRNRRNRQVPPDRRSRTPSRKKPGLGRRGVKRAVFLLSIVCCCSGIQCHPTASRETGQNVGSLHRPIRSNTACGLTTLHGSERTLECKPGIAMLGCCCPCYWELGCGEREGE